MLPALFRGELAGQLASFGGQPAAGSFFRVVELLLRGALRLFHNAVNLTRQRRLWQTTSDGELIVSPCEAMRR